jgi:7-cyano-7-deazaguanine reductase
MSDDIYQSLNQLGKNVALPSSPKQAILEKVTNPQIGKKYVIRFSCPEFTSMCPITGQPDFAHIIIDYIPDRWIVESKSLKLFLHSFRNHGAFHEDCTLTIADKIIELLQPQWLRIGGYWFPRGGIPIDIFYQTGSTPSDIWLPDQGISSYKPRY